MNDSTLIPKTYCIQVVNSFKDLQMASFTITLTL